MLNFNEIVEDFETSCMEEKPSLEVILEEIYEDNILNIEYSIFNDYFINYQVNLLPLLDKENIKKAMVDLANYMYLEKAMGHVEDKADRNLISDFMAEKYDCVDLEGTILKDKEWAVKDVYHDISHTSAWKERLSDLFQYNSDIKESLLFSMSDEVQNNLAKPDLQIPWAKLGLEDPQFDKKFGLKQAKNKAK